MNPTLIHFLRASAFGTGALLLAACAGKVIPGNGGSALVPVELSVLGKPVVPCDRGFAHPNVCCEEGPGKAASCGSHAAPFEACGGGSTTYPDPRSCCALDGSGTDCVAPPPPTPVPPPVCGYACPAGQYEPEGEPGVCCFTDGDVTACSVSSGSGGGGCGVGVGCECPACVEGEPCPSCDCPPEPVCDPPSPPPVACGCPACLEGEACPPCNCDPAPAPEPICGVCPSGWQTPKGEPYLCCCNEDSSGAIACFSQGVPPPGTGVSASGSSGSAPVQPHKTK